MLHEVNVVLAEAKGVRSGTESRPLDPSAWAPPRLCDGDPSKSTSLFRTLVKACYRTGS